MQLDRMNELDAKFVLNAKVCIRRITNLVGWIRLATCAQHYWRTWQVEVTKEYMILGHICRPRRSRMF